MPAGEISQSLGRLRELLGTFVAGERRRGVRERRAVELLDELGDTAVPLLVRKLRAGDEGEASWAYHLLARLGGGKVLAAARDVTADQRVRDERRALAVALLGELGAPLPESVAYQDPERLRATSVQDLVGTLSDAGDVARVAALLIEQVAGGDLAALCEEMAGVAGATLLPLIEELLRRDDIDHVLPALHDLRERLPAAPPLARTTGRCASWFGRHADGREVVLATRSPGHRRTRRAAMFFVTGAALADCRHDDDLPLRGGLATRLRELRSQGFALRRVPPAAATDRVARAACLMHMEGRRLPSAYFVARDLLGITDEHLAARRALDEASLLDRAERRLDAGDAPEAARLARRHVEACPDDADGRALLGSALLAMAEASEALPHLAAAARLSPDEPLHHWNHSHAAKQCDRMGACYLALGRYLALRDRSEGAAGRAAIARRVADLFERFARLEHPEASVESVARSEELFDRACAHLDAKRLVEAQSGFEAVLSLVPSHYQSWNNLAATLLAAQRPDEAARCLRRALELRPDYVAARKNLAMLERRG